MKMINLFNYQSMDHLLVKLKELLREIWKDFKNPVSLTSQKKNCCSATAFYQEDNLRPELIRLIQQDNKK